jgi:hypothetical protein
MDLAGVPYLYQEDLRIALDYASTGQAGFWALDACAPAAADARQSVLAPSAPAGARGADRMRPSPPPVGQPVGPSPNNRTGWASVDISRECRQMAVSQPDAGCGIRFQSP